MRMRVRCACLSNTFFVFYSIENQTPWLGEIFLSLDSSSYLTEYDWQWIRNDHATRRVTALSSSSSTWWQSDMNVKNDRSEWERTNPSLSYLEINQSSTAGCENVSSVSYLRSIHRLTRSLIFFTLILTDDRCHMIDANFQDSFSF